MATTLNTSGITMGDSTLAVSGSAASFMPRAWVQFNGQGAIAIRSSNNVSSLTDVDTGKYSVNWTSLPDANYCCLGSSGRGTDQPTFTSVGFNAAQTSANVELGTFVGTTRTRYDPAYVQCLAIET